MRRDVLELVTEVLANRSSALENPDPRTVVNDYCEAAGITDSEGRMCVLALLFPHCIAPEDVPPGLEELRKAANLAAHVSMTMNDKEAH